MKFLPFKFASAKFKVLQPFTSQNPKFKIKNDISCQAILLIFIFILGISLGSQNYLVLTQTLTPHAKAAEQIKQRILYNQPVKINCKKIKEIEFELARDRLTIITENQFCSQTIMQEVLKPQLDEGKIRTYQLGLNRKDIIVSF